MRISAKRWTPIALFIDRLLKPFGLVMWTEYYVPAAEDGNGWLPGGPVTVAGISFARRPVL